MRGHISNHAATVAEVLRDEGYTTFAVGKWHLCQMADASPAGPVRPVAAASAASTASTGSSTARPTSSPPTSSTTTTAVDPPRAAEDGYHLSEDLVDHAIEFIHDTKSIRPDRPFFCYLAFGATHAPHQAPPEYLEKYRGRFDDGLGRRPRRSGSPASRSSASCPRAPSWRRATRASSRGTTLPENHRRLAGPAAGGVRRVPRPHRRADRPASSTTLDELGELDNTIIVRALRQRGEPGGRSVRRPARDEVLQRHPRDARRGHRRASTRSAGRTATRTTRGAGPRPATRRSSGTSRTPTRAASTCRCIVHWPAGIADARRGSADQFHHVNDIVPDDLRGRSASTPPRRLPRLRADAGHRHVDALHVRRAADEPSRKTVQYFEMVRPPRHLRRRLEGGDPPPAAARRSTTTSGSCTTSPRTARSATTSPPTMPEKLAELVELLVARGRGARRAAARRPHSSSCSAPASATARPTRRTGATPTGRRCRRCRRRSAPPLGGRSWDMTADDRPARGRRAACSTPRGTENSGFSFFVQDDHLVFDYNCFGDHHGRRLRPRRCRSGASVVGRAVPPHRAAQAARRRWSSTASDVRRRSTCRSLMTMISSVGPSVGYDHGSPVSDRYAAPNPFTGRLHALHIDADPAGRHRPDGALALSEYLAEMGRQ